MVVGRVFLFLARKKKAIAGPTKLANGVGKKCTKKFFWKGYKKKKKQLEPFGAASAASLWGIKHFQDFKKASHPCKFESVNTVSYTNKMERYIQLDPLGAAFAASLRGIKHFQGFKKADYQ